MISCKHGLVDIDMYKIFLDLRGERNEHTRDIKQRVQATTTTRVIETDEEKLPDAAAARPLFRNRYTDISNF